ncbi:MAG: hypothetical protein JY451_13890 [Erythrobacter sp.]|nr:MAG: hypothetical protein JY451_13890 [Erythrobacter sp.]
MSNALGIYSPVINQKQNMQFSTHYDVASLTVTSQKADNWPSRLETVWHLHLLAWFVLEPVAAHFGTAPKVSSGYRSDAVNKAVGGSTKSQHSFGQAADFEIAGTDNRELAKWINDNLTFDQLILEFYTSAGGMASGWVHCSYKPSGNRKQFLTAIKKNGKTQYLPATTARLEGL